MENQILSGSRLTPATRLSQLPVNVAAMLRVANLVATLKVRAAHRRFELPLRHTFTPGLYARQVFMPKGALVVSKVHLTEHPYNLSAGAVMVWTPENGVKILRAPYLGVTQPGTVRVLYILEDAIWTTFHATQHTCPEAVEKEIVLDPEEAAALLCEGSDKEEKEGACRLEQSL